MRSLKLLVILVILPLSLAAQNRFTKITGSVIDSAGAPLPVATVVLLEAADSVMYGFTTTGETGKFSINRIEAGDYIIQVSFMGYGNLSKAISVNTENPEFSVGELKMQEESRMLDAVNITADQIPIVIKKDTIEYNADAFKTQPNAVVEDLLKRLPGVEVERDGTVKAQGEEVNQILVDGKEFFGDDPKIATKNLPADAIDKVQVFDKMSEMAEFTGVDDGERDKTINLALKDDKKNGLFGNITGGYGADSGVDGEGRYTGKINLNNFNDKVQLSVIGTANNINETNFSMGEYMMFMGGLGNMMSMGSGGGMIMIEGMGSGGNNGIMDAVSSGVNLNFDLSKKTEVRSSYFFNRLDNITISDRLRQNFLDEGIFTSTEDSWQNSLTNSHRTNLYLKHEFSKGTDIILRSNLRFGNGRMSSVSSAVTFNQNDQIENSTDVERDSDNDNLSINSTLMFRKKMAKVGRSLVTELRFNNSNTFNGLELLNNNDFKPYDVVLGFSQLINQYQDQTNDQIDYGGKISYTEPLGKRQYLEFNFTRRNYDTALDKEFYDIEDVNQILIDSLSSLYNRDYINNIGGVTYTRTRNKYNFNAGINYQNSSLKGTIDQGDTPISKTFEQVLPSMSFRYNFSTSKNFNLNYRTSLREPSLEQLQPIVNNDDPLNVYIGNPDLKAEFRHTVSTGYHSFNQFNFTSFFVNLYGYYSTNKITNSRTIDEFLRQTTTPVNVEFDKGLNGYLSFGAPLKFIGTKFNISSTFNLSRSILFINTVENLTDRRNISAGITFENRKKKILDWAIGTRHSTNLTDYSVNTELNQKYLSSNYFTDLSTTVKKWTIRTSFNYTVYSGEAFSTNSEIPLWTASIAKSFLKADRGELKVSVFDILNQNTGISRNSELNYLEEVMYNTLARYFMVTFTYNLSKFGKSRDNTFDIKLH